MRLLNSFRRARIAPKADFASVYAPPRGLPRLTLQEANRLVPAPALGQRTDVAAVADGSKVSGRFQQQSLGGHRRRMLDLTGRVLRLRNAWGFIRVSSNIFRTMSGVGEYRVAAGDPTGRAGVCAGVPTGSKLSPHRGWV
jgi:hypothetical protein